MMRWQKKKKKEQKTRENTEKQNVFRRENYSVSHIILYFSFTIIDKMKALFILG